MRKILLGAVLAALTTSSAMAATVYLPKNMKGNDIESVNIRLKSEIIKYTIPVELADYEIV